jgi:hypothetical protein
MVGRPRVVEIEIRASDAAMRALEKAEVPLEIIIRQHYCEGDAKAWRAFVAEAKGGDIVSRTEIDGSDMKETARFTTVTSKDLRTTRFLLEMEMEWEVATGSKISTALIWYREPKHIGEVSREPQMNRVQKIDGPVQGY